MKRNIIEKLIREIRIEEFCFENVIHSKSNFYSLEKTFRVYKDKTLGFYGCVGECNDKYLLMKARENLELSKEYIPEHSRDNCSCIIIDEYHLSNDELLKKLEQLLIEVQKGLKIICNGKLSVVSINDSIINCDNLNLKYIVNAFLV